jgi:hypothetical protein
MQAAASSPAQLSLEAKLRERLASGDAAVGAAGPALRRLLEEGANPLLGEDIVAGVRGMASDLARQLIEARAQVPGEGAAIGAEAGPALAGEIVRNPAMLGHLHALALEWRLTQRLQAHLVVDPVLPPLLQHAASVPDLSASVPAMQLLASQARFCQAQRRMQLPLGELPGDLLHGALLAMRALAGSAADDQSTMADAAIRARHDESQRLEDAGAAIFLTALALASGQDRDLAVLSSDQSQFTRLGLSLRAAGLTGEAAAQQLLLLHPDLALPHELGELSCDSAAAILAGTPQAGG